MAFIAIGAYGLLVVGGYAVVRSVELGIAWMRWHRRVTDASRRNHVHR